MPARTPLLALISLASLLASGCCCPQLSGRNCNPSCQPPCPTDHENSLDAGNCHCSRCGPFHHRFLSKWFGGLTGDGVPSQQAPDYVSPQPKFHPVPTRPAFEPQLAYLPPELIEPADGNPLRPLHGPLHGPLHRGNLRCLPAEPR